MDEVIFKLERVYYSYLFKFPALCGVDIQLKKGERVSVIGANGTGKSTLLQMFDGLIFPTQGKIYAFNTELNESIFNNEAFSLNFRKRVGFVFQNPEVQLFSPTVREDIFFGPLQLGMTGKEINKRVDKIISDLDIENLLDRAPYQLSIGEKRKVAIASVLAIDPEVIILDEPTAGLDPLTTRHIIDWLIQAGDSGKTVITSTHDLHIVKEIADSVYVFSREKRIVKFGSPDIILNDIQLLKDNNLTHIHAHRHEGHSHVHPHQHMDHHH